MKAKKKKKNKALERERDAEFFFLGIHKHRSHIKGSDWMSYYKRNQNKCRMKLSQYGHHNP